MPVESEFVRINSEESIQSKLIKSGDHFKFDFGKASAHVFCDPNDKRFTISFSGDVSDLRILESDILVPIEPEQLISRHSLDPLIICDREKVLSIRHTNVLQTSFKHSSADQK